MNFWPSTERVPRQMPATLQLKPVYAAMLMVLCIVREQIILLVAMGVCEGKMPSKTSGSLG